MARENVTKETEYGYIKKERLNRKIEVEWTKTNWERD